MHLSKPEGLCVHENIKSPILKCQYEKVNHSIFTTPRYGSLGAG